LVLLWERLLGMRLDEWRYVLMNFLGAGAFWVNHYFQYAPFWLILINLYTLMFIWAWWHLGVRGQQKSTWWKVGATAAAVAYTVAFIGFEQISRAGVDRLGMDEFCWMAMSYFGFVAVIVWRGKAAKSIT
ncbi:MAG: hypothetical protein JNM81_09630, partial [Rhodospirillaceae bacterium]|nr:hypothetical protein [Rhodospirillaceae bacterium]